MGGMNNETSVKTSHRKKDTVRRLSNFYRGCYEDYLAHPTAQYRMTFAQYKKGWAARKRKLNK